MQDIASRIFEGAIAYLNRQYRTIAVLAIVVAVVIGVLVAIFENEHQIERGIITSVAFLFGAVLSGLSGFIGMYVAVRSNIRTAAAARRTLGEALTVALRGGAVSGFLVVALGLLGVMRCLRSSTPSPKARIPPSPRRLLDRRLRLRRLVRRPLRPARRRHLHQGRRCWRRPRR